MVSPGVLDSMMDVWLLVMEALMEGSGLPQRGAGAKVTGSAGLLEFGEPTF